MPLALLEAYVRLDEFSGLEPDLLFAYGTLGPVDPDDARQLGWAEDEIRGRLFDLGPYPALIDLGNPTVGWVKGFVRRTDAKELSERLDMYEGVDEGLYQRCAATTRSGRRVWVYVYARSLSANAVALPEGCWRMAGSDSTQTNPLSSQEISHGDLSQFGLDDA